VFAAFEAAFQRFEAGVGEAEQSDLPMASLPWPPEDVPVSGAARRLTLAPRPSPLAPRPSPLAPRPSPLAPRPSPLALARTPRPSPLQCANRSRVHPAAFTPAAHS
jgi:hypothetical protein